MKNKLLLGLDKHEEIKVFLENKSFGIMCNTTSVDRNYKHIVDIFFSIDLKPKALFGPQHGFIIDKQDNMIESDDIFHPKYNIPIYSLYGETRIPLPSMLDGLDSIVIDIQDVGARVYTYIYTMANIMIASKKAGIDVIILDRPNPVNGVDVEGNLVEKKFRSFVGQYPIPNRHGMTIGELALLFNQDFNIDCDLRVIKMDNWDRNKYWDEFENESGIAWVPPSPNMPTVQTSIVYPGQYLLEATNLSEGRGTCTPFEVFGAPYVDSEIIKNRKEIQNLEGCILRPIFFSPTFSKYQEEVCKGFQIHVTSRKIFKPLKTTLAIIFAIYNEHKEFLFNDPPYEYEYKKMPIDILLGSDKPRQALQQKCSFEEFYSLASDNKNFKTIREQYLLY